MPYINEEVPSKYNAPKAEFLLVLLQGEEICKKKEL